ncbi:hypothetical protein E2C01_095566 [Portunus trituberculatus]|uniref:Uncharacterized protein n=1 Tax=Portunus trituberculatus TaxID=210409 RepID=A0A5B7K631_PORTR|nr:hypothetical protein [Portunus trituberculatus]
MLNSHLTAASCKSCTPNTQHHPAVFTVSQTGFVSSLEITIYNAHSVPPKLRTTCINKLHNIPPAHLTTPPTCQTKVAESKQKH